VSSLLPSSFQLHKKEDFKTPYKNGESLQMLAKRVWNGFLGFTKANNSSESIVIVSHMAVICTILFGVTKGNPEDYEDEFVSYIHSNGVSNGSISQIELSELDYSLKSSTFHFTPLTHSPETIEMYARIHMKKDSLRASYKKTSSVTNEVYIIEDEKKILM